MNLRDTKNSHHQGDDTHLEETAQDCRHLCSLSQGTATMAACQTGQMAVSLPVFKETEQTGPHVLSGPGTVFEGGLGGVLKTWGRGPGNNSSWQWGPHPPSPCARLALQQGSANYRSAGSALSTPFQGSRGSHRPGLGFCQHLETQIRLISPNVAEWITNSHQLHEVLLEQEPGGVRPLAEAAAAS